MTVTEWCDGGEHHRCPSYLCRCLCHRDERRCQESGCDEFPDAAWAYCALHLAEQEARGVAWARGVAVPRDVEIRRQP